MYRYVLPTQFIKCTLLNHIVSCRPCTTLTDIVAPSDRFRFVDGIVNGLKSLRLFPISKVFGRVSGSTLHHTVDLLSLIIRNRNYIILI